MRSILAVFCAILLPCATFAQDAPYPQPAPPPPQAAPDQQQQNTPLLAPQQLDNLVAPVALYPDPLLAQVLAASTYPLELVEAQQWLLQNSNLRGPQLMDAAKQQNWDPSVQAMVAFPDVMNMLNRDIRWTTDLGNAFLAQQADVMNSVQRMRGLAQQNGRLRSTPQETVNNQTQNGQSAIQIQPVDPQTMYVPAYNPAYVWGPPMIGYYPPMWYPPIGFGIGFGAGIFLGGFFGGFLGFGGWGWGLGWFGGGLFVNGLFFNHFGFGGYGGYGAHAMWAHNPMHRMGVGYPNRALAARYGAASRMGGSARMASNARMGGAAYRGGAANSGANYRGASGSAYRGTSGSAYRGGSAGGSAARPGGYAGGAARGYGGAAGSQGYRSGASSASRGPSSQSYRGSSSPAGRSMGSSSRGSAPSSRGSAPRGSSSSHSSGGGRSSGGGHSSGGHSGGHSGGGRR